MNYLLRYYDEIQKGNIIVGKELLTVLESLIKDIDNPRYIFDEKPGNIRIEFIETFCKHTKSPFNGEPFILELWEKAILQAAYGFKMAETNLRRFNEVILLIARKNGKTTFIAGIDLAEFFLSKGGVDIVCASNTSELLLNYQWNSVEKDVTNVKEELADIMIYSIMLADKYGFDIKEMIEEKIQKNSIKYPVTNHK